jgi:hypothetical protein
VRIFWRNTITAPLHIDSRLLWLLISQPFPAQTGSLDTSNPIPELIRVKEQAHTFSRRGIKPPARPLDKELVSWFDLYLSMEGELL